MSWKEEIKKSKAYDTEGLKDFTDALIKLDRALAEIQDIGSIFDSMREAEVAVKNARQDMEKRFEQYKRELRRRYNELERHTEK